MSALAFRQSQAVGQCASEGCTLSGRYSMWIANRPVTSTLPYSERLVHDLFCSKCKSEAEEVWESARGVPEREEVAA